jgi:hypothetical protein
MPEKLDDAALFVDPSHLFLALHMLSPGHNPYPSHVLCVQNGSWAVDVHTLDSESNLRKLAAQHGWKVEFAKNLEGQLIPIASLLGFGKWAYRDPIEAVDWAGHTLAPPPESSTWSWLDTSAPHMQFLLGAKDEASAQRILDGMSAHLTQGVRIVPILLEPTGDPICPFRYFWNVFLERPNPFLFELADRVWWGPLGHGHVQIFLEYPWALAVPTESLHRIPWVPDTGIVLLSRDAPAVVELRLAPDGSAFSDYLGAVELTRRAAQVSIPVVLSQPKPQATFKVDIRLGGPDPRVAARKRIEDLRREISAKQLLLEHIIARGVQGERDDTAPEPLFLYAQMEAERGRIPAEIQRLLLEWADQPEDLGAISYAFLPGEALPEGLFIEGTSLHIVASATALGHSGSFAAGARLLDYAPQGLNSWNLSLDQDWADHRLRLFAPATGHIWLYPNLRPSSSTAERLALAIHPNVDGNRQEWLYLLLPGFHGQLHFLLLPIAAFKPLSETFQWVIDLEAGITLPSVSKALRGRTLNAVCEAVDANLTGAVQQEATARLDKATGRLKNEVAALDARLKDRATRVQNASTVSAGLDQKLNESQQSLDDALNLSTELVSTLEKLLEGFQTSGVHMESLHGLITRHSDLRQRIRQQIEAVTEIRARWIRSTS